MRGGKERAGVVWNGFAFYQSLRPIMRLPSKRNGGKERGVEQGSIGESYVYYMPGRERTIAEILVNLHLLSIY